MVEANHTGLQHKTSISYRKICTLKFCKHKIRDKVLLWDQSQQYQIKKPVTKKKKKAVSYKTTQVRARARMPHTIAKLHNILACKDNVKTS